MENWMHITLYLGLPAAFCVAILVPRFLFKKRSPSTKIHRKIKAIETERSLIVPYKEKFTTIGELCKIYLETKERPDKEIILYRRVEYMLSIFTTQELRPKLEQQINRDLRNVVCRIKKDLGPVSDRDARFICYCIIGLPPELIGMLLGLSLSNVYTKKSRLKEKIRTMNSPDQKEYLDILSN